MPERVAAAIRGRWTIESVHWVLDVVFKEDQSRLRRGHGSRIMALVRRLAFNLVRGRERQTLDQKPPDGSPTSSKPSS